MKDKNQKEEPKAEILSEMALEDNSKKIGFDRVAGDLKNRLVKVGKNKGYSSFSLICAGGKEAERGNYSGGIIGDVGAVIEGLFYMARNQPSVKELLTLTVKAIHEQDKIDQLQKEDSIARLQDAGELKVKLFSALSDKGIINLSQLQDYTEKEVLSWERIGAGSVKELKQLMSQRNLKFKGCEKARTLKVVK